MVNSPFRFYRIAQNRKRKLLRKGVVRRLLTNNVLKNPDPTKKASETTPLDLSFSYIRTMSSSTILIALQKGALGENPEQSLFSAEGVNVNSKAFDHGKLAYEEILKGRAEMAVIPEELFKKIKHHDISPIASVEIPATLTRAITFNKKIRLELKEAKDLREHIGKMGVLEGSYSYHLLTRELANFFELIKFPQRPEPILYKLTPPTREKVIHEISNDLQNGAIDVFVGKHPLIYEIATKVKGKSPLSLNLISLLDKTRDTTRYLIVARNEIANNGELLRCFFRALLRANDFLNSPQNKEQALLIICQSLDIDPNFFNLKEWKAFKEEWESFDFKFRIHNLILAKKLLLTEKEKARIKRRSKRERYNF